MKRRHIAAESAGACALVMLVSAAFQVQAEESSGRFADVLQEVVVSATKSETRIGKVPISMSAYTQESLDLRGIRDIRDLAAQTPGLEVATASGASGRTTVTIRGISSSAGAATSAVYIDDTPIQARNSALNYEGGTIPYIFDLERVEVLRGPQGTLFGSSAQGGAVRFITPTPSLSAYSSYARATVNSVQDGGVGYEAGMALGGPLVEDRLGFRVSAYHRQDAGWIDRQSWQNPADRSSDVNQEHSSVFRAALNWQVSDWLNVMPSVYVQQLKSDDRTELWTRCPATAGGPVNPTLNPCPRGVSNPSDGKYISYNSLATPARDRFTMPAVRIVADLPGVTLTSASSYYERNVQRISDTTNSNDRTSFGNAYLFPITPGFDQSITWADIDIDQRLFAQELRLNSSDPDARIRWTAGAYYSRSTLSGRNWIYEPHYDALYFVRYGRTPQAAGVPPLVDGVARYAGQERTTEETIAAFGSVDIRLIDRLTLTVGARYSRDELDFSITERGVSISGGRSDVAGSMTSKPTTPKIALSWQASDDALYYASYARGYRTGGVNKELPDVCNAEASAMGLGDGRVYDPDVADTYELGSKSSLLGGTLKYAASVYLTKWQDIQQQLRLQCAFSLVANTAGATSKGFDLSVDYMPTDQLLLGLAVGYTDAAYDDTVQIGAAPVVIADQTLGAAPWTVNATGEYRFNLGRFDANVRAQYNYKSVDDGPYLFQHPAATSYEPHRYLGAPQKTLDLRFGVKVNSVDMYLYAENALNNTDYLANSSSYINGPLWRGATLRPRVIGIQAIARY